MTAGMMFTNLNGIIDTLSNKDIPVGERLLSSLTSVGMLLPMLLRGYKTLDASLSSMIAKHRLITL